MTWRMWVVMFLSVGPYLAFACVVGRMIAMGAREPGMADCPTSDKS